MALFSIDVSEHGQRCDLSVAGDIDLDVANQLAAMGLLSLKSTDATRLVIDLAKVTFMDSTGLGALVSIRNAATGLSKGLSLRDVPERIVKLLTLTGLDKVFTIEPADRIKPGTAHVRQSA
jgi:anti-sigma B factor antagonist